MRKIAVALSIMTTISSMPVKAEWIKIPNGYNHFSTFVHEIADTTVDTITLTVKDRYNSGYSISKVELDCKTKQYRWINYIQYTKNHTIINKDTQVKIWSKIPWDSYTLGHNLFNYACQ